MMLRYTTKISSPGFEGMGMCRPYGWDLGPKFSNEGPFFARFPLHMGGFSRNWQK